MGDLSFGGGSFFDLFMAIGGNPLDAADISFSSLGFGIDNLRSGGGEVNWSGIANNTYTLNGKPSVNREITPSPAGPLRSSPLHGLRVE